jgi:GTPase
MRTAVGESVAFMIDNPEVDGVCVIRDGRESRELVEGVLDGLFAAGVTATVDGSAILSETAGRMFVVTRARHEKLRGLSLGWAVAVMGFDADKVMREVVQQLRCRVRAECVRPGVALVNGVT